MDDDKVVAQLVEKFFSSGTNQHDPSTIAQRLESAIREAIQETRKQQWIPVGKELPGRYRRVIAASGHFVKSTSWNGRVWSGFEGTVVTHWMPLPEPPVDSKDAAEGTEAR